MNISEKVIYKEEKYTFSEALCAPSKEKKDEIIDKFLSTTLEKRKPHEIDLLRQRLKEKSLLLEKAPIVKRKKKSKKPKLLASKFKRIKQLNLYHLNKASVKYEHFLLLHNLWKSYMSMFANNSGKIPFLPLDERLLRIDYHGAILSVFNSKCKNFIDIKGIVAKETKHMFTLVTVANDVKILPKKNIIFLIELDDYQIKINGDAIIGKPGNRVVKKIKGTCVNTELFFKNNI